MMNHAAETGFLPVFVMWSIMMLVMMFPAASPMILLFARARGSRTVSGRPPPVTVFAAGYFLVWIGFSLAMAILQLTLHRMAMLTPAMAIASRPVGGFVLAGAGLFQFTSLKRTCLAECRSPVDSLVRYWRDGTAGALQMGARQGLFCLGCCWAEMFVLFVVGVMNLQWIVLLAAFVVVEKLAPAGVRISRAGGVIMMSAGLYLLAESMFR